MSDHTRADGAGAPSPDPHRTPPVSWVDESFRQHLGARIDDLTTEGTMLAALVLPWADSVRMVLADYEHAVAPLHLDEDTHRRVAQAAGIEALYDLLDALTTATATAQVI